MVILILEKYNHTPSKFKFLSFTEVRLALLPQDMIKNTSFRLNRNKIKFTETASIHRVIYFLKMQPFAVIDGQLFAVL